MFFQRLWQTSNNNILRKEKEQIALGKGTWYWKLTAKWISYYAGLRVKCKAKYVDRVWGSH